MSAFLPLLRLYVLLCSQLHILSNAIAALSASPLACSSSNIFDIYLFSCSFQMGTYIYLSIAISLYSMAVFRVSGVRLVERDYLILNTIDKWRVITGRHICHMCGFSGQRSCDRRLAKLISIDLLSRKKVLYGVPSIYSLTSSGKRLIEVPDRAEQLRIEQITHDISVADTAIYFNRKYGIDFSDMTTEKQLHKKDGFGLRKHRPDFVFTHKNKTFCVEIELALKSKDRFEKNIVSNFTDYDGQFWIVPDHNSKIAQFLSYMKDSYTNIRIIELQEVKNGFD